LVIAVALAAVKIATAFTSTVGSTNPVVAVALAGQQAVPQKPNGPLPLTDRPQ
jgi:hypothetical protein